jgi:hypothetical protein
MTKEEKIAGAAEIVVAEFARRGNVISLPDAAAIASKLYGFWFDRVQLHNLKPGEIAQHFRSRYAGHPDKDLPEA